jgi:GNAT superfamily N-acetyltransferase
MTAGDSKFNCGFLFRQRFRLHLKMMTEFSQITIRPERPDTAVARMLIDELESILDPLYPAESRHGLSVERLLEEQVAFFVARNGDMPVGCGGLKFFGNEYAELKRMYVRPDYQGLGWGKRILMHLEGFALSHEFGILRLETGIHQQNAIGLYRRMGYREIPPFGDYQKDPLSLFFEKSI